jgi:hypothetical protein
MLYTHYWSRAADLDRDAFSKAAEDARLILSRGRDMGLAIAGPTGTGKPIITESTIAFNGSAFCGHRYRDLGKPFASETARGVEEVDPPYDAKKDDCLSGPFLETRVCGGICAAEPFLVDRVYLARDWERPEEPGTYSCSCMTHFKPYDLLVTATLIRLKEHLGKAIIISSENPDRGFDDALRICRELFGWPTRFEIEKPLAQVLI